MTDSPEHFDLIVIGAGSGNMIVDSKFDDLRVAIIEKGRFGGTCLNVGCIPSKMLAYTAEIADTVRAAPTFGIDTRPSSVRWKDIRARVFDRLDDDEASARSFRTESSNVTVLAGAATFTGPKTLEVSYPDGSPHRTITADRIVLAAGGRPVVPPAVASVPHHTSDTIMRIDVPPSRLLVVGGGYIAAELAHVFWALGSDITIIDSADHLLDGHDLDVTRTFTDQSAKRWDLRLGTEATSARCEGENIVLTLDNGDEATGDMLLVAAGRTPNSDIMDCAAAGIELDGTGHVVVDDQQRTNLDGIFALGDICNTVPLKHVANHEAHTVAHNLLNTTPTTTRHDLVPSAVFGTPQIASIGRTEQQLRDAGTPFVSARTPYSDTAYGWAMQDRNGFCKLLAEPSTGNILGAHIIGPHASTMIHLFVIAMTFGIDARRLAHEPYWTHPALPELVENALLALNLDKI
jgi:mycothione reductase